MYLAEDTILENRYRVDHLLSHGGMGAIYKAFDLKLKIPVALKENFFHTPQSIRQFEQELLILARLHHPSLPRVIDHFSFEDQQYLVMDFIEGQNLWELVKSKDRPLEEKLALEYIIQICQAVSYLHQHNPPIIHRDIKPQNIKVTPGGQAVLVDFGIAKMAEGDNRTKTGARGVTPGFSPPEQYSGTGTTPASDIYALGATLYAILTGQKPPDSVSLLVNQAKFIPPNELNIRLSQEVTQAIVQAMQPQPENRPASVAVWQKKLELIYNNLSRGQEDEVATVAASAKENPSDTILEQIVSDRPTKKYSWGWAGLALGAIGLIGVIAFFAFIKTNTSEADTSPTVVSTGVDGGSKEPTHTAITIASVPTSTGTPLPLTATHTPTKTPTKTPTVASRSNTPTPTRTPLPPTATRIPTSIPTKVPVLDPTSTPNPTASSNTHSLGDTKVRQADGMVMVYVPAGEFYMGSGSFWGEGDERPQRTVYLDAFWIDRTEVSFDQYLMCMNAGKCQELGPNRRGDPAKSVSWYQANDYCTWIGGRLPTEAEWEKTARGTDARKYPWGKDEPDDTKANYCSEKFDCRWMRNAAPVGSFPGGASPYGALDMAGNVWEWVADWYDPNYYTYASAQNPLGPETGDNKVLKGGSYNNGEGDIRSANRHSALPKDGNQSIGFRCVVTP